MKVAVKVVKTFEGVVDIGALPPHALKFLLEDESGEHDVNPWELELEEETTAEVTTREGSSGLHGV